MAKKALLGLAAAAAVLIAVFVTTGWPPTLPGSEGAIGAAKRHQAQQMTCAGREARRHEDAGIPAE